MKLNLTALLVVIALAWAGFASSSFAYHGTQPEMTSMGAAHHMTMDDTTAMQDCPSHKAGQMKMDTGTCAVACYGLVSPVVFEPAHFTLQQNALTETVPAHGDTFLTSRVSGVPTPPPNFA